MDLNINRVGNELALVGSIDLVSRGQLVDAGMEVLGESDSLTLDMQGVDFMDSVGIGALIELSKAASARGGSFVITEPSPRVQRILAVTGLDGAWTPSQSADNAG